MRNKEDNSMLSSLVRKITSDPKGDYDDALFHTLLAASALGKEVILHRGYVENYGKKYRAASLSGEGLSMPLRSLILSFATENFGYDGFLLDNVIIEKGFIEELISGIDDYMVEAVVDDYRTKETEAVVLFSPYADGVAAEESEMNSDYVINAPLSEDKKAMSIVFRDVLSLLIEMGVHSVSIPVPEAIDPALFSDIAVSSVYAFSNLHPEHFLYVSFVAPSDEILGKMTGEE